MPVSTGTINIRNITLIKKTTPIPGGQAEGLSRLKESGLLAFIASFRSRRP